MKHSDTKLIDFLESLEISSGCGWQVRYSSTDRGYRLLTTTRKPNYASVRIAIGQAIANGIVRIDRCFPSSTAE